MITIPRYLPRLDVDEWIASWRADPTLVAAAKDEVRALLGIPECAVVLALESARQAIHLFFRQLVARERRRTVLVSAQICPVVPLLLQHAGFAIRFVDIDDAIPSPGAKQYRAVLDHPQHGADVAAVLISPMYGHLPDAWEPLLEPLGDRALVLDLAQGLCLAERLGALLERADAVVYSFGLGKGVDTGGGLLVSRAALRDEPADRRRSDTFKVTVPVLAKAAVLRGAVSAGFYGPLVDSLNNAVEVTKAFKESDVVPPVELSERTFVLWAARLRSLADDVARARERAKRLYASPAIADACRDTETYASMTASHFRQIVRLRKPDHRDTVVTRLRRLGVDAMPAGEPLPHAYLPMCAGAGVDCYPNAGAFVSDAIRLPFLGRLSFASAARLQQGLERSLEESIP